MKSSIIGYPRVGRLRELKFWTEDYFKGEISKEELVKKSKELKQQQWLLQKQSGIDYIPSNDFSFYDGLLDTAYMLNVIPERYKELDLDDLDTYFAMARGYQGEKGDEKALSMKKWFNTNYHYMVPEIDDNTEIKVISKPYIDSYKEAQQCNIKSKVVIIGGFTFLKLAKYSGKKKAEDFMESIADAYINIIQDLRKNNIEVVQIDEPSLVQDLSKEDISLFTGIYNKILEKKREVKIILQTYFGDIRDCYDEVVELNFDGIGLDFLEGKKTLELIKEKGFPSNKILFAGVINGKNIWRCNYKKTNNMLKEIKKYTDNIVVSSSCSLLHIPYTIKNEYNKIGRASCRERV